jgi:hypothetical protein
VRYYVVRRRNREKKFSITYILTVALQLNCETSILLSYAQGGTAGSLSRFAVRVGFNLSP